MFGIEFIDTTSPASFKFEIGQLARFWYSSIVCEVVIIPAGDQARQKQQFIAGLGPENTLSVGNGANDVLMLKHAAIGIAVMQDEGVASAALLAADLVVKNILDLFALLNTPERIMATLRN